MEFDKIVKRLLIVLVVVAIVKFFIPSIAIMNPASPISWIGVVLILSWIVRGSKSKGEKEVKGQEAPEILEKVQEYDSDKLWKIKLKGKLLKSVLGVKLVEYKDRYGFFSYDDSSFVFGKEIRIVFISSTESHIDKSEVESVEAARPLNEYDKKKMDRKQFKRRVVA